jgi:hypothetical protein
MDVGRSSRMLSVAVKEGNGRGRSIESFLITAEVPGRYTLATSVDGAELAGNALALAAAGPSRPARNRSRRCGV